MLASRWGARADTVMVKAMYVAQTPVLLFITFDFPGASVGMRWLTRDGKPDRHLTHWAPRDFTVTKPFLTRQTDERQGLGKVVVAVGLQVNV